MKVLFVCLGNICRSPLAEALFYNRVTTLGLQDRFETDSCGTSNYNLGCSPDRRTVKNAGRNGIKVDHVARQLSQDDFDLFDIIIVMDSENFQQTMRVSDPKHHNKIKLMRSFDPLGGGDVPDPYYGGEEDFQQVFEMLDRSVTAFVMRLIHSQGL